MATDSGRSPVPGSGHSAKPEPVVSALRASVPNARRGMFRVESIEDQMRDVMTFEIVPSGERVTFTGAMYRELGIGGLKKYLGMAPSTARLPVKQSGRIVGTLPDDFDPLCVRSTNFFYDPRSGDFVLRDNIWEAARTLGPGDLEAVPGFVWESAAQAIEAGTAKTEGLGPKDESEVANGDAP